MHHRPWCNSLSIVKNRLQSFVLKIIHRVVEGQDFDELLSTYEKRFGDSRIPGWAPDNVTWHSWKWPNTDLDLELDLMLRDGSRYVEIQIHSRELAGLDFECIEGHTEEEVESKAAQSLESGVTKYFCVPTHEFVCVNKDLPLYDEGCQVESGREGAQSLTLDLANKTARYCWKSDGACDEEKISVEISLGAAYITRNPSGRVDMREYGVLNFASQFYGETSIDWAASNSLMASTAFYVCSPTD